MRNRVFIRKQFAEHKEQLTSLLDTFDYPNNKLIYNGRNVIKGITLSDGLYVVVKAFKTNNLFKAIIYTLFKNSKAKQAYSNGIRLEQAEIRTPKPIGYIEVYKGFLIHRTYLITEPTSLPPIKEQLIDAEPFNEQMTKDFANFVATLHKKGILHKDLNNTNVLYNKSGNNYEFTLIDINRMHFVKPSDLSLNERYFNMTLFCADGPMFRLFLKSYMNECALSQDECIKALKRKKTHDNAYRLKKLLLHPSRWFNV
nr:hypothetical protein [Prevotella sp.]